MITRLPSILEVFWTQALVALPSIRIMQVPHAPSEHPFLTEVSPSSSRRKVSRRSSRSVETVFPLTMKVYMAKSLLTVIGSFPGSLCLFLYSLTPNE